MSQGFAAVGVADIAAGVDAVGVVSRASIANGSNEKKNSFPVGADAAIEWPLLLVPLPLVGLLSPMVLVLGTEPNSESEGFVVGGLDELRAELSAEWALAWVFTGYLLKRVGKELLGD